MVWKTSQKRWMIETDDKGELGKTVQTAGHDDNDAGTYAYLESEKRRNIYTLIYIYIYIYI